jgi:hypothetical protein
MEQHNVCIKLQDDRSLSSGAQKRVHILSKVILCANFLLVNKGKEATDKKIQQRKMTLDLICTASKYRLFDA